MPQQNVSYFRRRPCRAWLIEALAPDIWYARRIGIEESGKIVLTGSFDFIRLCIEDADNRCGLPILYGPAPSSSTGAA